MKDTKIQWCDHSWSPWLGCRKVSPACENCYITSTPAFKFRGLKHGADRVRTSESYWKQPLAWNRKAAKEGVRYRVFPSLCDPFDGEVPINWFVSFFKLVMDTSNLDWLLLTKRPREINARMLEFERLTDLRWDGMPDNVLLGVSVENQEQADKRIPVLLSIPARVRFLSVEPMLGPIDLSDYVWEHDNRDGLSERDAVDWVIFGGESGPRARPCNVEWIRDGVRQCREAGVACFVKQLGSFPITDEATPDGWPVGTELDQGYEEWNVPRLTDKKGGDPSEWPEDLRLREFPQ